MRYVKLLGLLVNVFLLSLFSYSQEKQNNQLGSDILADAPWRMKKTNDSGNLNGIPIHIFIKDAEVIGNNAELISLNIYIKNAIDTLFASPIVFDSYSDSAFLSLFSAKSVYDATLDIQSFDASLPVKSSSVTISFTADDCVWPDECTYVDIAHNLWYFTITIPPEKLIGFNDIIDIKVDFSLNWQTDVQSYLRVFRHNQNLPKLNGWYRGDSHYHSMYTNNTAEFGLPLAATKEAAKAVGIDWITLNDHSCDYDNYGTDIQSNWNRRRSEVQSLNNQDSSMIFIGATEVSVNNSVENIIHMLCYPSDTSPYSLPFLGDGNGDIIPTSLNINDILFTLSEVNGFAFAAHPFSSGDELSALVDGGIWNVGDIGYLANGTPVNGFDEVICNDVVASSDFYSQNPTQLLFKSIIKGGEIWNTRNALSTTDEMMNPWNVTYDSGITPFSPYDLQNNMYHYNRLLSNFDASLFLWKKGLIEKNANPALQNYRFYISAGSDAHGNFNYSNTDFVMSVVNDIHDNAIGKPATIAFCPQGIDKDGGNLLAALQNGNILISDGPLVNIGLCTDGTNNTSEYIIGQEAILDSSEYFQSILKVDFATTPEFGTISSLDLIAGTIHGEYAIQVPANPLSQNGSMIFDLDSIIQQIINYDTISGNEYFYLRSVITTNIDYGSQSNIYRRTGDTFHCFTNPIWIRKPLTTITSTEKINSEQSLKVFPNPAHNQLTISLPSLFSNTITLKIYDMFGKPISEHNFILSIGNPLILLSIQNIPNGVYYISATANNFSRGCMFVKN